MKKHKQPQEVLIGRQQDEIANLKRENRDLRYAEGRHAEQAHYEQLTSPQLDASLVVELREMLATMTKAEKIALLRLFRA